MRLTNLLHLQEPSAEGRSGNNRVPLNKPKAPFVWWAAEISAKPQLSSEVEPNLKNLFCNPGTQDCLGRRGILRAPRRVRPSPISGTRCPRARGECFCPCYTITDRLDRQPGMSATTESIRRWKACAELDIPILSLLKLNIPHGVVTHVFI